MDNKESEIKTSETNSDENMILKDSLMSLKSNTTNYTKTYLNTSASECLKEKKNSLKSKLKFQEKKLKEKSSKSYNAKVEQMLDKNSDDILNSLKFYIENLLEIIFKNEQKFEGECDSILDKNYFSITSHESSNNSNSESEDNLISSRSNNKLAENKEFFREFINLDKRILKILEEINNSPLIRLNEQHKKRYNLLLKSFKDMTIIYQGQWNESYWIMYNSCLRELESLKSERKSNNSSTKKEISLDNEKNNHNINTEDSTDEFFLMNIIDDELIDIDKSIDDLPGSTITFSKTETIQNYFIEGQNLQEQENNLKNKDRDCCACLIF
jgi:hypothetical protein